MIFFEQQPAEDPQVTAGDVVSPGGEIAAREASRITHTTAIRAECG